MAAVLAIRLRRPSPGAWYLAAGLSAYVGLSSFWLVIAVRNLGLADSRSLFSLVFFVLPWLAQLVMAVACWRSRAFRRQAPAGDPAALPG